MFQLFRNHIFPYWKSIIVMSVPLLLLPLPVISGTKVNSFALCNFRNGQTWWLYRWICQEASCGYIILIMAIYWMTEALPLPITSLIPVVAFPLFGILDTGTVCMAYMKVIYAIFISFLCVWISLLINERDTYIWFESKFSQLLWNIITTCSLHLKICIGNKHDVHWRTHPSSRNWVLQFTQTSGFGCAAARRC